MAVAQRRPRNPPPHIASLGANDPTKMLQAGGLRDEAVLSHTCGRLCWSRSLRVLILIMTI